MKEPSAAGSVILKAVPRAHGASSMLPPQASTRARQIASPKPVPPSSLEVVKNGSKTRLLLPGEMPGPSSHTAISTVALAPRRSLGRAFPGCSPGAALTSTCLAP